MSIALVQCPVCMSTYLHSTVLVMLCPKCDRRLWVKERFIGSAHYRRLVSAGVVDLSKEGGC